MDIVFLSCAIFLIVLAIPLFFGKMSNFIAGYNTMDKQQKQKYDELKLCRIMAMILTIAAIILFLGAINLLNFNDTVLLVIVEVFIGLIIGNFLAKNKS